MASKNQKQTCAAEPEPVTEVADGQLPDFQVGDWEDEDYVRPDYTISNTVDNLHGWVRVAGDNEFDLSERGYGKGFGYGTDSVRVLHRYIR